MRRWARSTTTWRGLDVETAAIVGAIYAQAREIVPEAEQGKGYGMPALRYRGKALLSVMATKSHLSLFPFSAAIVAEVAPELEGYDLSKGTIGSAPIARFPLWSSRGSSRYAAPRSTPDHVSTPGSRSNRR